MTLQVWERAAAREATLDASSGAPSAGGAPARGRRRARGRLLWAGAVLVALALVALAVQVGLARSAHRGQELDPQNTGPEGARAVARVVDDKGTRVRVVRSEGALDGAEVDGRTTVVVTRTDALSAETARSMLDHARGARRLVLVAPSRFLLTELALPVVPVAPATGPRAVRAGCNLDGLSPTDTVAGGADLYSSEAPGATPCFTVGDGSGLVSLPPSGGHPEVVVLGDTRLLRNDSVTRLDAAGVAVRLLTRGDSVVWYVPSFLDVTSSDTTATSPVPKAIGPLVFLALWALLVLMVWRGRRFGPLVTEPLPAVVKAIETTQSRGRLYRKAGDAGRAGEALRARTVRRLAARLGLPAGASAAAVARAAAEATGQDAAHVSATLAGPPPTSESALVDLAHDLSQLEKDVRRA
ncbi:DUF4350 domain-containing protein [Pedococcus sp. NPDC057267]|uniref:DUF4350 domain-containing protein n=1 Tax=Pedococcus sp. NPDC057267 TaxID=3346077 RepID=UPI0036266FE0